MAFLSAGNWALAESPANSGARAVSESLDKKWGIHVTSLHLSANGYMVDFATRWWIREGGDAGDPTAKPYLVDQATGARLVVPGRQRWGPCANPRKT